MKKLLKSVLFMAAVSSMCVSCGGDDEDSPEQKFAASSLTNSVISGKIESFISGSINQMMAILILGEDDNSYLNIGQGEVSSTGSFSVTLAAPVDSNLCKIEMDGDFAGNISDTTALISYSILNIYGFNGENLTGGLLKSNFSDPDVSESEGASYSIFVYCNKALIVSGKATDSYVDSETQASQELIENDNFALVKGWNELVYKITKSNITSNSIKMEVSLTNAITSDLKWRLFSADNLSSLRSSINTKYATFQAIKTPLLFRSRK